MYEDLQFTSVLDNEIDLLRFEWKRKYGPINTWTDEQKIAFNCEIEKLKRFAEAA